VTTRLARSPSLESVAGVVTGPLRAHLSATATALAVREGGVLRFVHPTALGLGPAGPVLGHPAELSTATDTPIAATARDGIARDYASSASIEHDFPDFGASLRAAHTQALAAVPLMVAGQSIGALAVGWRGARPVHRLRPLLTIVAMHTADATVRVTSPRPGSPATRPAGMRAPGSARRTLTEAGSLRLDLVSRSVFVHGRNDPIRLTGREFELLLYLVEHSGTTLSRHDTMRDVWGIDFGADTSVVDVTISRLRRKLGTSAIVTVRDQGYMIR
jgi:hypothetical protein